MPQFFGDKYDNPGGGVATTRLFGYLDVKDAYHTHPVLREGENNGRFRKAMSELRGGMLGCYPVIGVSQLDGSYGRGTPLPHIGHDCQCGDECEVKTGATRYHGIYITIPGKADVLSVLGGYGLLEGKARIYVSGATFQWMGTHPLDKVDSDFADFQ